MITGVSKCSSENLNEKQKDGHYRLVLSPSGWLDFDIIHEVYVCLRNINPDLEGLQRPTLGPVRNFNQVNDEFIQILHTPGNAHGVCVGSVGREDGTVNLYDSLYDNIILNEVQQQVLILVGRSSFPCPKTAKWQWPWSICWGLCYISYLWYTPWNSAIDVPKKRTHLSRSLNPSPIDGCGEAAWLNWKRHKREWR